MGGLVEANKASVATVDMPAMAKGAAGVGLGGVVWVVPQSDSCSCFNFEASFLILIFPHP